MSVSKQKCLYRRDHILNGTEDDNNMTSDEENSNNFDCDDDSEDCDNEENSDWIVRVTDMIPSTSYEKVLDQYTENQKKIEPSHIYKWVEGEKTIDERPTNEVILSESTKKKIVMHLLQKFLNIFFREI